MVSWILYFNIYDSSASPAPCDHYTSIARAQSGSHHDIDMVCRPRRHGAKCTGLDCNGFVKYKLAGVPQEEADFCLGIDYDPCNSKVYFYMDVKYNNTFIVSSLMSHFNLAMPQLAGVRVPQEEADFCLGIDYDPCNSKVYFYMDIPKKHVKYNNTFTASSSVMSTDSYSIPGMDYTLVHSHFLKLQLYLDVIMEPVTQSGSKTVKMNLISKVKIRIPLMNREIFPSSMRKPILRDVILIPQCNSGDKSTPHDVKRGTCKPMASITTLPTTTRKPGSATVAAYPHTNRTCDKDSFTQDCDPASEECHYLRFCVCKLGFILRDGLCYTHNGYGASAQIGSTPTPTSGMGKSTVVIIAGSVVAGVVAMAIVVVAIVMVVRKRRSSAYQGRQLVLSTDDDDII